MRSLLRPAGAHPVQQSGDDPGVAAGGFDDLQPETLRLRRDPRMGNERGAPAPACARALGDARPQVAEPFAGGDGDRGDPPFLERGVETGDVRRRSVSARCSRPPSPRKITMRLPRRSANRGRASSPSLTNVVAGTRVSAMPSAASASAVPGPGASATRCAGQLPAGGAPNSAALAETNTAKS